jgi:hypothetical protein
MPTDKEFGTQYPGQYSTKQPYPADTDFNEINHVKEPKQAGTSYPGQFSTKQSFPVDSIPPSEINETQSEYPGTYSTRIVSPQLAARVVSQEAHVPQQAQIISPDSSSQNESPLTPRP